MSKFLMIFKKIDSKDEYQENNASFLRKAVFGMKEMFCFIGVWSLSYSASFCSFSLSLLLLRCFGSFSEIQILTNLCDRIPV